MSITGRRDGESGRGAAEGRRGGDGYPDGPLCLQRDPGGARASDGVGCRPAYRPLALLDVQIAALANQTMNYLTTGQAPVRMGNAHPNIVPYQDFPTADGAMILAVGMIPSSPSWPGRGASGMVVSAPCSPPTGRGSRTGRPSSRPSRRFQSPRRIEGLDRSAGGGGRCPAARSIRWPMSSPTRRSWRGARRSDMTHAAGVEVPLVANPIRMSVTPPEYRTAPPVLGEHTRAVLGRAPWPGRRSHRSAGGPGRGFEDSPLQSVKSVPSMSAGEERRALLRLEE